MATRIKFGIMALVLAGLVLAAPVVTKAAPLLGVSLESFDGYATATGIVLHWVTASESDNLGFDIYRALSEDAEPSLLNEEMIPSQAPGSGQGEEYFWTDTAVLPGTTYYYYVESISTIGFRERYGPLAVTAAAPTAVTVGTLQVAGGTFVGQWLVIGFIVSGLVVAGYTVVRRRS